MKIRRQVTCLSAGLALAFSFVAGQIHAQIPDPLVRLNFDGGSLANTGTLGGNGVLVAGTETTPTVSQLPDGRWAYDATGATAMGTAATQGDNGYMSLSISDGALDGLLSFTITGWYRTTGGISLDNDAQLVNAQPTGLIRSNPNGERNTASVYWDDNLADTVVGGNGAARLPLQDTWIFFALVYDGTLNTDNLRIINALDATQYQSNLNTTAVGPSGDRVPKSGFLRDPGSDLIVLGSRAGFDQPFKGYLTDVRFYGSATDASGALSDADIQSYVIPEPSTYGLGAGLAVLLVTFLYRRKKA